MADVADVAVEGLDVVAVGIEQEGGVVALAVFLSVARLTVRLKPGFDARLMEAIDFVSRGSTKTDVQVVCPGSRSTTARFPKEVNSSVSSVTAIRGMPSAASTVS